jgi:hypothetical protein
VDSRTTYVAGLLLLLASRDLSRLFQTGRTDRPPFTGRMMSIGVMSAFLLNVIFRIGATRRVVLEFEKSDEPIADLYADAAGRGL